MLTRVALAGAVISASMMAVGIAVIDPTSNDVFGHPAAAAMAGPKLTANQHAQKKLAEAAARQESADASLALAPLSLGHPSIAAALVPVRSPGPDTSIRATPKTPVIEHRVTVGKGDTLAKLLGKAGVARTEAHQAIGALSTQINPRRIRRGQDIVLQFQPQLASLNDKDAVGDLELPGRFNGLIYAPDYRREIVVSRADDGAFTAHAVEQELTRTPALGTGTIHSSLYVDGRKADVPAQILVELFRLYAWDVDFQRDIRKNDGFEIMYERIADADGKPLDAGDILMATLTLSGKPLNVYRHVTAKGHIEYFNEKGESTQKALMRTPIDGARLSSRYGARKHPILGYTRMHRGVDFAAPRGTPIYAAGNGTVIFAGRKGGYGKYVRIRHNRTYSTAYAHMKGYGRGIRAGTRVRQGQVIGYVGTTGRSTGPHLHYEIISNGKQVNPLRVRMPAGRKLQGKELARFMDEKKRLDALAEGLSTGRPAPAIAATDSAPQKATKN